MAPLKSIDRFAHSQTDDLCVAFSRALIETTSLNGYLEVILPALGRVFSTSKVLLVDYMEQGGDWVLLHFEGYGADARHALQRRLKRLDLDRALGTKAPYRFQVEQSFLAVPLYFRDILEAVLILEGESSIELSRARSEAAEIASRFLGLLMSSSRLQVNQALMADSNDLKKAREIQLSFLPARHPRTQDYEIFAYNRSSALVGGDYFDYFPLAKGTIRCILADACGHGMSAALIISSFRGLLQSEMGRRDRLTDLFDCLNLGVHAGEELVQYLTGVLFHYEQDQRLLLYLNAGHYDPLIVGREGEIRTLDGGGPPLGMFRDSRYQVHRTRLRKGDLVTLFTDGLIDIRGDGGSYFGVERLTSVLRRNRDRPLRSVVETVLSEVHRFGGSTRIDDDVTLLLMRVG